MDFSFLALGDSYTIGDGVDDAARWPVQLSRRLSATGVDLAQPRIIARTGWTTDELLAALGESGVSESHDLVTLLAGVNDQYRGHGVGRFRSSWQPLLARALRLAKLPGRLLVLSIPDWGVTPFASGRDRAAIAREIDEFNNICRATTQEAGASFVDVTPASRQAATEPSLLAADGLHPSATMYSKWVDLLVPITRGILATS